MYLENIHVYYAQVYLFITPQGSWKNWLCVGCRKCLVETDACREKVIGFMAEEIVAGI